MAYGKPLKQPVLLGYADEFMDNNRDIYTTNKLGGEADWPCSDSPPASTVCGLCGASQALVCQIYAPLDNSKYHRTLYIFCCLQPLCWNKSGAWTCFRSQLLAESSGAAHASATSHNITGITTASAATDWLGDADDWGDDNESTTLDNRMVDEDNGNIEAGGSSSPGSSSPDTANPPSSPMGAVGGFPATAAAAPGSQASNRNLRLQTGAEEPEILLMQKLGLRVGGGGDDNANNANFNAASSRTGCSMTATAEIELDSDDNNVIVDMPVIDGSDIPSLFRVETGGIPRTGATLLPRYIYVEEEGDGPPPDRHEMALLKEYQIRGDADGGRPGGGGSGGEDGYERALPCHGDELAHKLISVIQKNPGQILRYCRGTESAPLVYQRLDRPDPCRYCGADTVFELQLMPTLVSVLECSEMAGVPVEFGTVLLFTCSKSCWEEEGGGQPRVERLIVQAENM